MTASSDPSAQQTATKQSWKANFSQKQLERKRHVDRISQRRNRQKSKETATLFKDKMDLLVEGDHKTLLERMSMENDAMKAKLDMFKAKFEHVHRISKECLQVDADSDCSRFSNPSSSIFVSPERETTANSSAVDGQLGNVSDMLRRSFSQQPSIFFGIMEAMEHGSDLESQEISSHRFIETVLAWKYSKGLTDGLDYLARHYNLRGLTEDFAKDGKII
ncbi:hypothetical protein N7533_012207 [Penicillium manginii]|jgi:hypothetical protein|uniref:uncharacterized protein n=1 Tax=Penicillium manginii TaxID=203109 RepID=UPI002548DAC9|nr:uncharacterized protein N7533_012207 [Penicillium manginii]KAJ5739423.1 hypothetical protein N7533_012207 [Penicillium manginii]